MAILSLEDNVRLVYEEAAKKAVSFTPILYEPPGRRENSIEATGSGVFFYRDGHHFLVTAGHCIKAKETGRLTKIGVLDRRDFHRIQGEVMVVPGGNNEIDIGLIRLSPASIDVCRRNYAFLDDSGRLVNSGITGDQAYLLVGFPVSRVVIDHRRRRIRPEPLVYICQSTEGFKFEKHHFHRSRHLMLGFDRRRSTFVGSGMLSSSPYPQGISGCGVWYIPDYFVGDIKKVEIKLAAILIEYFDNDRLLGAVKFDVVDGLLRLFSTGKEPFA